MPGAPKVRIPFLPGATMNDMDALEKSVFEAAATKSGSMRGAVEVSPLVLLFLIEEVRNSRKIIRALSQPG